MKKLIILMAVQLLAFTSVASAATYQVDFDGYASSLRTGDKTGWTFQGSFVFDDSALDKTGVNEDAAGNYASSIDLVFTSPGSGFSDFVNTASNAALWLVEYDGAGNLIKFELGGNFGGADVLAGGEPDFLFDSLSLTGSLPGWLGMLHVPGFDPHLMAIYVEEIDINEVNVSAVPLPAAAWMFLAGLGALFGGQKWRIFRRKPALT